MNGQGRQKTLRLLLLSLTIIAMFGTILFQMGRLQIAEADHFNQLAESISTRTITLTGMRGTILDANMIPLARDRKCYNVQFDRDPSLTGAAELKRYTEAVWETIRIIEGNGKRTIDEFWLKRDERGAWQFETGALTEGADASRIRQWRANFLVQNETRYPVGELFDHLCRVYAIPEYLPEADKLKILAIWQEQRMNNFLSKPVTIAYDVGFQTIAQIEARSDELPGISISEGSERVYTKGTLAAHSIGYVGKISTEGMEDYLEKGYPRDAFVGVSGIEYSMEDSLTPFIAYRQGSRVVEVNSNGKIIRELSRTEPLDGSSVVLTLRSDLQLVVEQALADGIRRINWTQIQKMNESAWQNANAEKLWELEKKEKEVQLAQTGAVAVYDMQCNVLALASYPTFDLSLFGNIISAEVWDSYNNDPTKPLLNRAITTRDTPGSIFKMVTALAGLMEGEATLDEEITDAGEYLRTDSVHPPKCWIPKGKRHTHANLKMVQAISQSCNYYFFTIGDRLGSTRLTKWAAQLGLTSLTGIELRGEAVSFCGNQLRLYDPERAITNQYTSKPEFAAARLRETIHKIGEERNIKYDEIRVNRVIKSILDLAATDIPKDNLRDPIYRILETELNLPTEYISRRFLGSLIISYLNDLRWTANETIMASIGQSITQVTPVAVARYAVACANGGTVYNVRLVDKIIHPNGEVTVRPNTIANQIEGASEYFAAIQEGMRNVTSVENDGTAANEFKGSRYNIAAKTGTAQRSLIDIENNSWLIAYAPAEDPKIVVVVYVQNGYAGLHSSKIARTIIDWYLDNMHETESTQAARENTLAD